MPGTRPGMTALCSAGTSRRFGRLIPMRKNHALIIASILLASAGSALAQAPPSPSTPAQQTAPPAPNRPANCSPMEKGTGPAPEGQTTGQNREPLGDKL